MSRRKKLEMEARRLMGAQVASVVRDADARLGTGVVELTTSRGVVRFVDGSPVSVGLKSAGHAKTITLRDAQRDLKGRRSGSTMGQRDRRVDASKAKGGKAVAMKGVLQNVAESEADPVWGMNDAQLSEKTGASLGLIASLKEAELLQDGQHGVETTEKGYGLIGYPLLILVVGLGACLALGIEVGISL